MDSIKDKVQALEKELTMEALREARGNILKACKDTGKGRGSMENLIRKYHLQKYVARLKYEAAGGEVWPDTSQKVAID